MYQHTDNVGEVIDLPVNKVVCVGRNYEAHINEMNKHFKSVNTDNILLFMKPSNAICSMAQPIKIPDGKGECHNEIEVALLLCHQLTNCESAEEALEAVWGVGLALDLTLRDIQLSLKQAGQPWERAKAFDGSCPVSAFIPKSQVESLSDLEFSLQVNSSIRQQGNTSDMLVSITDLIMQMSNAFTLNPGDILLTGTPSGVGPLVKGDVIHAKLSNLLHVQTEVIN